MPWNFLLRSQASVLYAGIGHNHAGIYEPAGAVAVAMAAHEVAADPHAQYLTAETDPVFSASAAAGIAAVDILHWNTAYGWGPHAGLYDASGTAAAAVLTHEVASHPHPQYITAENDPVFLLSAASGITAADIAHWHLAYGWGPHVGLYDVAGSAAAAIGAHEAASDPHPQYLTAAEGNAAYSPLGHDHAGVYDPAGTAASAVSSHGSATAGVHGIPDTALLVITTDPRLVDARVPVPHAVSHATGQADAINPAAIGAAAVGDLAGHVANTGNPHAVTKDQIGLGNVEDVAISTWGGSTAIATVGTITAGTWQGAAIGDAYIASAVSWNAKLGSLADDATPQLGGSLDANGHGVHFGVAESVQAPSGTTAAIDLGGGNHHTLDCSGATGTVVLTLTIPGGPTAGTIIVKQGATARSITWIPTSGSVKWLGTEPAWATDVNKFRIVSWRWDGAYLFLSATETD